MFHPKKKIVKVKQKHKKTGDFFPTVYLRCTSYITPDNGKMIQKMQNKKLSTSTLVMNKLAGFSSVLNYWYEEHPCQFGETNMVKLSVVVIPNS